MSVLSHSLTYADLLRERETRDERLELIEGEIVVTPSPSLMHQIVILRLAVILDKVIVEPGLGLVIVAPFDVYLDEENVPQPDVMVVLPDRLHVLASAKLESAPSLAIEVISPSSATKDRVTKRNLYARHGVPEYWIVDSDARTITIFSDPRDGRYHAQTVASEVAVSATIPGLSVDLAALFAPVPGF
ncbi:MAG: Uma2 family endonuclease [Thermomicrobiales bacterium]